MSSSVELEARTGLSDRERAMLEFLQADLARPRGIGAFEAAITETFGCTVTRFWLRVNALVDRPEAAAEFPILVHRLRRVRMARERPRLTESGIA